MRHTLLISVAAVALATSGALAQSQHGPAGPSGAPAMNSPSSSGPSESMGPGHEKKGTPQRGAAQEHTGPQKQHTVQQPTNGKPQSTEAQDHRQPKQKSVQGEPKQKSVQRGEEHGKPGNLRGENEHMGPKNKTGTNERFNEHNRTGTNERFNEHNRQGTNERAKEHNRTGANERPMTSRNVSLTTEQKTTIREKVLTPSAPRVTGHVNFNITVGTVVPRTIRIAPVPTTLVEIEPQWRGYMYFVSGDEIIVVEPNTLRIVAVLDV